MKLDDAIENRHSVRVYKKLKKADYRDAIEAVFAAIQAPSAGNLPTLRFILVQDPKIINDLGDAAQQPFIKEADFVVVVCTDRKQVKRAFGERADMYCPQQAGAAIENFLLKIVDLGLASCWIGAFADSSVRRIVRVPEGVEIEALLPVGYEEIGKHEKRPKPDLDNVLYFNQYGNKFLRAKSKPYV